MDRAVILNYYLPLQILEKGTGKRKSRVHVITKGTGLKTLARSVGRKSRRSIARQVMKDKRMRELAIENLSQLIQKEMTDMCSRKSASFIRDPAIDSLKRFSWDAIANEVQRLAPTLHQVLKGIVNVKRYKGSSKRRSNQPTNTAVLGICASILMRHRNIHMNHMQRIISLILNCGHASKQVCTNLR